MIFTRHTDRSRKSVEAAFGELATCLNGEVETLGYPKAALFAFCVALVSYNTMGVVKAALRSVQPRPEIVWLEEELLQPVGASVVVSLQFGLADVEP